MGSSRVTVSPTAIRAAGLVVHGGEVFAPDRRVRRKGQALARRPAHWRLCAGRFDSHRGALRLGLARLLAIGEENIS